MYWFIQANSEGAILVFSQYSFCVYTTMFHRNSQSTNSNRMHLTVSVKHRSISFIHLTLAWIHAEDIYLTYGERRGTPKQVSR